MCGIFGVFGHPDAAALTVQGLQALQHRGQDGAGLISYDGRRFHQKHTLGLVNENLTPDSMRQILPGHMAIGHVRYGTQGDSVLANVQPFLVEDLHTGGFALAHNGHFSTLSSYRDDRDPFSLVPSDTVEFVRRIARLQAPSFLDLFIRSLIGLNGSYACGVLTPRSFIAACDPVGIRPLVLGRLGEALLVASETCALDHVGAAFLRDVENGEVIEITREGLHSYKPFYPAPLRPCIFEYIYFAHPNSRMRGHLVSEVRQLMGEALGEEAPVYGPACVIPIPDSGCHAALGYGRSAGIPYQEAIDRDPRVRRTFLTSVSMLRHKEAAQKYRVNSAMVLGQRVVLVDDSLVRGTTLGPIVRGMREAGAREIHLRIASPPLPYPDFYGLDLPNGDNLLAARYTHDEMQKLMGVDSLAFLSLEGIYRAFGYAYRDPHAPQLADHCFTGDYPTTQIRSLKSAA